MAKEIERLISQLDQPGTITAARELAGFVAGLQNRGVLPHELPVASVSSTSIHEEQLVFSNMERPVQLELSARDAVRVGHIVQEFFDYKPGKNISSPGPGPRTVLTPRLAHQFRHLYGGTASDDTLVREIPMDELYWENVNDLGWNTRDLAGLSKIRGHFRKWGTGKDWAGNVWTVGDIREASFTRLLKVKGVGPLSAVFLKFAFAKL